MHIPDGYLGPPTYGALWASMVPAWLYASRKVKKELSSSQVPHLAMASAFSLAVMVFAFPLPGGTTGHLAGSALLAILLGPWACVIAISVALFVQAMVFGDGGITALGANCFNMALAGGLVGHWTYRIVAGKTAWMGKEEPGVWRVRDTMGAALAGFLAINAAALLTALELGIQPLLHGGSSGGHYFPYGLAVTVPAVMIPHLTAVGALEAGVTVLALGFLRKLHPKALPLGKSASILVLSTWVLAPGEALAHEFWLEAKGRDLLLVFGHGADRAEFDPANVTRVRAWDPDGGQVQVTTHKAEKSLSVRLGGPSAVVVAEIDNGYWCRTIYGWKNVGKSKASRVVEAIRSLNYAKVLLAGGGIVSKPTQGVVLDIVPNADPSKMRAGEDLEVKVLFDGKPASGVEVTGWDHKRLGTTDVHGMVRVPLSVGQQLLAATCKKPLQGDPEADFLSVTATLAFDVSK